MSRDLGPPSDMNVKKRQRESNVHLPTPARKSRKLSDETSSPGRDEDSNANDESSRPPNKHTKKERKQNRSTRIHSLRKQIARGTLPSTIQQEKERELAALLHEQGKNSSEKQAKKNLEKYHYVRFLERRKAEKRLKQLRKSRDKNGDNAELREKIHNMEVNRNYAVYAPLGQKYISIFVAGAADETPENRITPESNEPTKPAMWYTIEAAMLRGEKELEKLRDSRAPVTEHVSGSDSEDVDQAHGRRSTQKDTGKISRHRTVPHPQYALAHRMGKEAADELANSSEDDDADGGFFER